MKKLATGVKDIRMDSMLTNDAVNDLRSYCYFLTKSKWDSEDLFQETLLRSMVYVVNWEPARDAKPFLFRVAKNLWIDICRSRKRRSRLSSQVFPLYYRDNDYAEVRQLVEWLAERLPRRNIEMWLLAKYFNYTMQEIADTMDCTIPTVKAHLFRTRKYLHRLKQGEEVNMKLSGFARLDTELWSQAIMRDLPPCL
ncbi:RNA polymerase sigma factor [Paenibacillus beijingensis]|uniref:RNA polymerase sigma factor n=1 Tax=Paenibacillus beijingensis TaxID=1126833 RepID=A0A0D5NE29_9BACL|nr:RNA polymerase sigma factor [Paenibacillus beijingensis]AJY73511.1 hypothetical protein VN24_01330 [Paenibacillus beijingensis]